MGMSRVITLSLTGFSKQVWCSAEGRGSMVKISSGAGSLLLSVRDESSVNLTIMSTETSLWGDLSVVSLIAQKFR